jgi:hypothetical protein
MHRSPSVVPPGDDLDIYLVLDDFGGRLGGKRGGIWKPLLNGQYVPPSRLDSAPFADAFDLLIDFRIFGSDLCIP